MKCLVCSREFNGGECDVCKFPIINFPGENLEDGMRSMQPTITAYRSEFFKKVTVGVQVYRTDVENGLIVTQNEENVCFGLLSDISKGEKWLEQYFDHVSNRRELEISVCVTTDEGYKNTVKVNMPNEKLSGEKKLKLGIRMNGELSVVLCAKGEENSSETLPFFLFK